MHLTHEQLLLARHRSGHYGDKMNKIKRNPTLREITFQSERLEMNLYHVRQVIINAILPKRAG